MNEFWQWLPSDNVSKTTIQWKTLVWICWSIPKDYAEHLSILIRLEVLLVLVLFPFLYWKAVDTKLFSEAWSQTCFANNDLPHFISYIWFIPVKAASLLQHAKLMNVYFFLMEVQSVNMAFRTIVLALNWFKL